jgi:hypothetical protein
VGSPEGNDALNRNVAAGVPAALAFTGAVPVGAVANAEPSAHVTEPGADATGTSGTSGTIGTND